MKPVAGIIVALFSFTAVLALAGPAGPAADEPAPGTQRVTDARARQEAAAREHFRLYEEWLRETRERNAVLARDPKLAEPDARSEAGPG